MSATKLAFAETTRLARDLAQNTRGGGIKLKTVVVNRVVDEATFGDQQVQRLAKRQRLLIRSISEEGATRYVMHGGAPSDVGQELVGVFGLRFLEDPCSLTGMTCLTLQELETHCLWRQGRRRQDDGRRFVSRWPLPDQGLSTAIVSTDPAHSVWETLWI